MADIACKTPLRRQKAAEIDTTLPYQNVKAAVRMFGEKGDSRMIKSHERHGANEAEMRKLKEDLAKARAQVVDLQKDKKSALSELEHVKKLLEANQVCDNSVDCEKKQENLVCTDKMHIALEGELKEAKEQHAMVLAELEAIKREMSKLEQDLCVMVKEKENAMRQAEEALSAAEVNAKRAEELSKEISGTKESLQLVKMACIEASKEREALLAAKKSETSEQMQTQDAKTPSHDSPSKLNKLGHKLNAARAEFTKEELKMVRHHLVAAREALANIEKLKAGCGSPVTDATISIELEAANEALIKALDNDALQESILKELQDHFKDAKQELDATKLELVEVRSRELHASSEVIALNSELERVKEELKAAVSCNEAFVGLSQKLQKIAVFEDESARAEDVLMRKVDDEAKAELHAMLKEEAEAVRQAELRRKMSQPDCLNEHVSNRDRLEPPYEDNKTVLLKNKASNSSHTLHEESIAYASNLLMRASGKEEHKKKKQLLPSFSALLSRSKRGRRKVTSPTREDA